MSSTNHSPRVPRPAALADEETFRAETVIGGFPLSEAETTAAFLEYGRDRLLHGVELLPPAPPWAAALFPARARRLSKRLARLLGGWFEADLDPFVRFHCPPTGACYCSLRFRVEPWQVHLVGLPDDFLCVFFGRALPTHGAVGPGGHPIRRPFGPVQQLLHDAAPSLPPLRDRSAEHAENVFDAFLVTPGITVKAGVRRRLTSDLRVASGPEHYYGIRINLDPHPRT